MRVVFVAACVAAVAACGEKTSTIAAAPVERTNPPPDIKTKPIAEVAAKMVGKFRLVKDAKVVLTISADGDWIEEYKGDPSIHGKASWRMFRGADGPAYADMKFAPASSYLEIKDASALSYFELGVVDDGGFDVVSMLNNTHNAYKRVE